MSNLVHCFELYRGELAKGALAPAAVIGAFDPQDNREAQLLSRLPALTIEHVVLQQSEERLHGRVVSTDPGPTHRTDETTRPQRAYELARTELAAAIGVHHSPEWSAQPDGVV